MEPEKEDGPIEYKLKLLNKDAERIDRLCSQMRYRCDEGNSECIYIIGVTDDGKLEGINDDEFIDSFKTLSIAAEKNNYSITKISEKNIDEKNNKKVYELLVREKNEKKYIDIKIVVSGNVDAGKCLSPNTPIIMYNGKIKKVNEIILGDLLMGDDSECRKVLKLYKGETEMYKIIQKNGDNYNVTNNHILSLKFRRIIKKLKNNKYCMTLHIGNGILKYKNFDTYKDATEYNTKNVEILDISVSDYINKSEYWKTYFISYRTHINFKYKKIDDEPYKMGYDLNLSPNYIYNTTEIRLKLLAGLIDSIGNVQNNMYVIINDNKNIVDNIKYLARSLGYNVMSVKYIQKNKVYYHNSISGENIENIPVQKQKIMSNDKQINTIKIMPIGVCKYNGFELDGNGRFLLGDFTVTHNSSLIGTLITGKNDDGRGSSRLSVFNFKHEINTGRTSSIAQHILGFDSKGEITNYCNIGQKSWPEIVNSSSKIVSFFDLAGHEKYLKTTILGMTSTSPDCCMIVVGGNMGITKMTREHLFLCITLNIPFIFVITKIDICKNRENILKETIDSIHKLIKLPGSRKVPYKVNTDEDIITVAKNLHSLSVVPIFQISNVTGEGIDNIKKFLNIIPKSININENKNIVELYIDHTYYVPGVGTVIGGQLLSGSVKVNDKLLLGPNNGKYTQIQIRSIHCKRVPVQEISYGCYICLALKKINRNSIKRGNVVISMNAEKLSIKTFTANVKIMKAHSTTIRVGYETVVHVCNVRQTARIMSITNKVSSRKKNNDNDSSILRTGDKADVTFSFVRSTEYIKKGQRLLFCENLTKAIGVVI